MPVTRALLYVCVTSAAAACATGSGLSRVVPVRPCAAADSLLGPRSRDATHTLKGHVYQLTQPLDGIRSGRFEMYTRPNRVRVRVEPRAGTEPGAPQTLLDVEVIAGTARAIRQYGRPLGGSLVVDDSLTFSLGLGIAGPYEGPEHLIMLVVSFSLPGPAFLALARANAATLLLTVDGPPLRDPLAEEDRRDIAALYVISVCGTSSDASRPSN